MMIPGYWSSKKQLKFQFTRRCSNCRKFSLRPHYFLSDGTRISSGEVNGLLQKAAFTPIIRIFSQNKSANIKSEILGVMAECPNCGERWPVFAGGKTIKPVQQAEYEVIETHRSEEKIGAEQREIDNSKSNIEIERRITVSKEWSKSVIIEEERTRKGGIALTIGLSEAASVKAAAEEAIKSKYITSEDFKQIHAEEVVLKVPGHTKLLVIFNWKRILQHGIISFQDEKGNSIEVPFKIVVGVTFDQTQVDQA